MRLTFLPEDVAYTSQDPILVSEAAAQCDLLIEHPCGTRGRCTRCRVRFLTGAPTPTRADTDRLSERRLADGWRLSCQALVGEDATIEVPTASRASGAKSFGPDVLPPVGELRHPEAVAGRYGIAIDLGSTTVAGALIDLASTRVLAHGSTLNAQARFGGDVISRIRHAMDAEGGAGELTRALRGTVADLVDDLVRQAGVAASDVTLATACGNGAMSHGFAGENPVDLGLAPYHGVFTEARALRGEEVGWTTLPGARVLVLPQIASHVGGDTVAAILATGMYRRRRPELLVDLGTNTEIVLATPDGITTASAAAGPAFEGAQITHGMRATAGAIDRVSLASGGRLLLHTVGGTAPAGLCGTGLIDATAALLELGVIEPGGRLLGPDGLDAILSARLAATAGPAASATPAATAGRTASAALAARARAGPNGNHSFVLAGADQEPVALYAQDVRQLQLVKGSIVAAIELLLDDAGVVLGELRAVHVAGAFGTRVRKWSALRIGLVPPVDPERIRMVGDAAAVGARMALCFRDAWSLAERIGTEARHVELATDPRYTDAFAAAIPFPAAFPAPVETRFRRT